MFFLFLLLISSIPFCIGIAILRLFKSNNLSKVIFIFLLMTSFWQLDVTFLYAHKIFSEETVEFFFRLFRFGSIMVTPTVFHIGYTIVQEELPDALKKRWSKLVNRKTLLLFYAYSLFVYIIGWSDKGIKGLELVQIEKDVFYFPVNGELSWIYNSNVLLFIFSMIICFLISKDVQNKSMRSFLLYYNIFTSIGYVIGIFNMFPESKLYPSSITVLVFAISVLILLSKMNLQIVEELNQKLYDQRQFLSNVIDLNPNFIYAHDQKGRYTLVNQSYAGIMGIRKEDMIGKTDDDIYSLQQKAKETIIPEKCCDKRVIKEESITTISDEVLWVQTSKIPLKTAESESILLAVSTDITERKQYEDEIRYQAYHDALTGLPNRRMFNEDLTRLLQQSKSENYQNAIMFLDLDRFKYINDTLGHDVGDLLLIEVSIHLERLVFEKHCEASKVYRLGGDEFTILLPNHDEKASEDFAKSLLDHFKTGFVIEGNEYFVTPSIGISLFPKDGDDAKTLIKHADTAMYDVKDKGKNNFKLFTKEMQHHFYRKMMIEKQLRKALERDEFELYFQPIMNLKTNEIVAVESLLRWNNATLGQVPPDDFIPIAEETGMIIPIGKWVLETAIDQNVRWQKAGYNPFKISVNVSVMQLLDPLFVNMVKNAVENSELDPTHLVLEVTESIAMYEAGAMIEKLQALKDLGISLSMDDFGTGYSSLSYLKKYPLDSLKIDRSFVTDMMLNEDNKAIVKTIIAIAKQLDLKVTAEGIEGNEEYQFLAKINCDYGQGYGISKPLPAGDFEKRFLKS